MKEAQQKETELRGAQPFASSDSVLGAHIFSQLFNHFRLLSAFLVTLNQFDARHQPELLGPHLSTELDEDERRSRAKAREE